MKSGRRMDVTSLRNILKNREFYTYIFSPCFLVIFFFFLDYYGNANDLIARHPLFLFIDKKEIKRERERGRM